MFLVEFLSFFSHYFLSCSFFFLLLSFSSFLFRIRMQASVIIVGTHENDERRKKRGDEREKADRLSFVIIIVAHFSCLVSTTLLNSFFLCVFVSLSLSLVFDSHYTSLIVNARMTFFVEYLIKNSS